MEGLSISTQSTLGLILHSLHLSPPKASIIGWSLALTTALFQGLVSPIFIAMNI